MYIQAKEARGGLLGVILQEEPTLGHVLSVG